MAEMIASNALLKAAILLALFALVAGATYVIAKSLEARQLARRRLLASPEADEHAVFATSLRAEQANNAWVRLVNRIEKSGLSLVDTKDEALRRKLAAAGFTASYAPRAYTLLRLVLVVGFPVLVMTLVLLSGSVPSLMRLWIMLLISAAVGLYLPSLFIRARTLE